ncbi:MAG: carotenoid oxygenase family protein [Oceanicaulis sp.]|nr:carotenoid oxygenase family protein [Oceanicaulis sp.]
MNAPSRKDFPRLERDAPAWLVDVDNPYLRGLYAPVKSETTAEDLDVIGEIPADLCGAYMRNGPNQAYPRRPSITGLTATAWCTPSLSRTARRAIGRAMCKPIISS